MTDDACPEKIRYWPCMIHLCVPRLFAFAFGLPRAGRRSRRAAGFSAMVVDAHTGKVLFSHNPDAAVIPPL